MDIYVVARLGNPVFACRSERVAKEWIFGQPHGKDVYVLTELHLSETAGNHKLEGDDAA